MHHSATRNLITIHCFNLKPHPHLHMNSEWGMRKWEKCWCGHVAEAQRTAFVCAANVRWTAERYSLGVGTAKKNTLAMLSVCLTRRMPNKPLLGIVQMWTYLNGSMFGGAYGDARMPNWPHRHRTPLPGSPHRACVVTRGNALRQATLLPSFLLCYSSVWKVRLHSPFI